MLSYALPNYVYITCHNYEPGELAFSMLQPLLLKKSLNYLPAIDICCKPLQIIWTQIRQNAGLAQDSNSLTLKVSQNIFLKTLILIKSVEDKYFEKLPQWSCNLQLQIYCQE